MTKSIVDFHLAWALINQPGGKLRKFTNTKPELWCRQFVTVVMFIQAVFMDIQLCTVYSVKEKIFSMAFGN